MIVLGREQCYQLSGCRSPGVSVVRDHSGFIVILLAMTATRKLSRGLYRHRALEWLIGVELRVVR